MGKFYVTREGYELLYNEVSNMDKKHDEVEKKMGESVKRDNDLRENPEYMALRVEAMYSIPQKKKELSLKLQNAVIIEDTDGYKNWDGNTVLRKCNVQLLIDGELETYTILGANEGSLKDGILSCEAPLVSSILDHKVGDTVEFNGMMIKIQKVSKIEEKKLVKTINEK